MFCEETKDYEEDYSFGTLIRLNCEGEYSEENTILVTRVQFHAIEIARNRHGLNSSVWEANSLVANKGETNSEKKSS